MLNILVCLYLLNSVHRVVVSTHSLPHTLSVSNTVRTLYSDSDPVFTSVPRLAWENRHGWLHLFATFQTKLFALYFSFYVRLVRRKNWFLNCNSVKVRFVFNSLWIKFRFYFVQKESEKNYNYSLALQIIQIKRKKMKWNWNQILWLICERVLRKRNIWYRVENSIWSKSIIQSNCVFSSKIFEIQSL